MSSRPADAPGDEITVIIELEAPPAAQIYAQLLGSGVASSAQVAAVTQPHIAGLKMAQAETLAELDAIGIAPLFTLQRVYNGIAARVVPADISLIEYIEGVKAVHRAVPKSPTHTISVPHIGAPELWRGTFGVEYTGTGVSIGIIDTGIDYIHTDFGGAGIGYFRNDPTVIGDVPDYPGVKVVGGFDFAGDSYDANPNSPFHQPYPKPDPDPTDCYGHGTHVAGTAAGFGVRSDGTTYRGPYDEAIDPATLRIGPGVAPHAQLYSLKVFGCSGSTELTELAIEWAVDPNGDGDLSDHLDVINLSLGSSYGSEYDASSIAADNAAMAGVIVVASAGNSGDTYYVTGSPAAAQQAISVASTVDRPADSDIEPTFSNVDTLSNFSSRGPRIGDSLLKPDLGAPGQRIYSAASGSGDRGRESSGTSMAAPHVAGGLALLHQHAPAWQVAELKARIMNTGNNVIRSGGAIDATLHGPTRIGSGLIDLPAALATEVIAYNADQPGAVSVSFGSPQVLSTYSVDRRVRVRNKGTRAQSYLIDYSSRIDTPGVDFDLPRGQRIELAPGQATDIAITMRASATAMRHTRDSTLNAVQGASRHWMAEEAGYLLLWPSTAMFHASLSGSAMLPSVETESSGVASLVYSPTTGILSYTIQIDAATGISEVSLRRGFPNMDGELIERLYVAKPVATAPQIAGDRISGTVILGEADEALLSAGGLFIQVNTSAFPQGELRGALLADSPTLNVPIHAAPRPSALLSTETELVFGPGKQRRQPLAFRGVALTGSTPPTDVISLAGLFVLQSASPPLSSSGARQDRGAPVDMADIQYVGVMSDYHHVKSIENSTIYFGLSSYGKWSSPAEVVFNILIDVDEDGRDDYRVFNSNEFGFANLSRSGDAFVAIVQELKEGHFVAREPLNALLPVQIGTGAFESKVMILPVSAAALGLKTGESHFRYRIASQLSDRAGLVDLLAYQDYDPTAGAIQPQFSGIYKPFFAVADGAEIPVRYAAGPNSGRESQILVIQPHNDLSGQAQLVNVSFRWPNRLYLPLMVNR